MLKALSLTIGKVVGFFYQVGAQHVGVLGVDGAFDAIDQAVLVNHCPAENVE